MSIASHVATRPYKTTIFTLLATTSLMLAATDSFACACGCGIFDVGTDSMLPTQQGGMAWVEYDFMNQDKNWHNTSSSPQANNADKDIKTNFMTVGGEYMFNRSWGTEIEVPYDDRHFTTDVTGNNDGNIHHYENTAFGDVRIQGIYSGFSGDMSTGVTFGLRLPTGDHKDTNFDRDSSIGSGSTDLLLGGYHMGNLAGQFNWFANILWDQPFMIQDGYRPGSEVDGSIGTYYNGWTVSSVKIAPLVEILGSERLHDRGIQADPEDSGYQRVMLAPGIEVDTAGWRVFADVAAPVYQKVKGEQLTAPELFKLNISHSF